MPFKQFLQPPEPSKPSPRIYNKVYRYNHLLLEPDCNLSKAVAAFMFGSDALQQAAFGEAFLWPGYVAFENQSKGEWTKPHLQWVYTFAYFPKVLFTVFINIKPQ